MNEDFSQFNFEEDDNEEDDNEEFEFIKELNDDDDFFKGPDINDYLESHREDFLLQKAYLDSINDLEETLCEENCIVYGMHEASKFIEKHNIRGCCAIMDADAFGNGGSHLMIGFHLFKLEDTPKTFDELSETSYFNSLMSENPE